MGARTTSCRVGSSIAYAVGRSPLVLATEARSLDEVCAGRLVLGLGTGTRRMMSSWHGVDPDGPASRLEELVPLLRRLWRLDEGPVTHHGRFYDVDISPTAEADPPLRRRIPIFTAGVNPRMVEVAGRVADGFLGHPLFTADYVAAVVRPALATGAEKAGRAVEEVETVAVVICAVDDDEDRARREAAAQIAFYAAPRTYARVLEVAGFGAAATTIREAFRVGDHDAMVAAVTDEMIDRIAVAGTPDQVADGLTRYDGTVDHVIVYPPSFRLSLARCREVSERVLTTAAPPS